MALSEPKPVDPSNLPQTFPIWPGVCAGLATTLGLVGCEIMGKTPRSLIGLLGGVMTLAHGMVAFAVVTLLGEALSIASWERTFVERRREITRRFRNDPLLHETIDPQALKVEIEQNVRALTAPWRETRQISLIVAYIVPLIGFAVAAWNSASRGPWEIVGRPLLLTLVEAFFVILLIAGVGNSLKVVKSGWLLISPKGAAHNDPIEELIERPAQ